MDTLYYRKIAEIVRRDVLDADPASLRLRGTAERVLVSPRDSKARLESADKRALKTWMRAWCDLRIAAGRGDG